MFKHLLAFMLCFTACKAGHYNDRGKDVEEIKKCSDTTFNGTYKWTYRGENYTVSKPICWHDTNYGKPVFRRCNTTNGMWVEQKFNCMETVHKNRYCPEDLEEISGKKICLKISAQPQQYNDAYCYGSDTTILDMETDELTALLRYLSNIGIERFWLPLHRANENKHSKFSVRLPGKLWGEVYNENLELDDLLTDKHCLVLHSKNANESQSELLAQAEVTHCDVMRYAVCVFRKTLITTSGCPQGFGALSYRPNICYGVNWESGKFPNDQRQLAISEFFANQNVVSLIFDRVKTINDWFELYNFQDESGTAYVLLMNKRMDVKVLNAHENRKHHGLCTELMTNRNRVEMVLKTNAEDVHELVLVVYNRHYIWRIGNKNNDLGIKCFTNADYGEWNSVEIDLKWENNEHTKSLFTLELIGDGPGEYWCEAHTIFDFEFVQTERIIASKSLQGHTFAMSMLIPCIDHSIDKCQNLSDKNLKKLSKLAKKMLKDLKNKHKEYRQELDNLKIHDVRIMAVEDYKAENGGEIRCLTHVTVSHKNSAVDNSDGTSSEEDDSNESVQGIRHDTAVRMELLNLLVNLVSNYQMNMALSVRSTEYCFPEAFRMHNGRENQWLLAKREQAATTLELCLKENGIPQVRRCVGSFIQGAVWESYHREDRDIKCADSGDDVITRNLYNLDKAKIAKAAPVKAVEKIRLLIQKNVQNLVAADIHYMAKILQSSIKSMSLRTYMDISHTFNISQQGTENSEYRKQATLDIVRIYNYLMKVNAGTLHSSIVLNSTNILLDSFETLIDRVSLINHLEATKDDLLDKDTDFIEYVDIGVSLKATSNLVIFTIDPAVANVTGIAIFRDTADNSHEQGFLRGEFSGEYYRFLQSNDNLEDIMNETDLQLATYVPSTLLARLDEISTAMNSTRSSSQFIVVKVYSSDKLFQENENLRNQSVGSRVVSISIPGLNSDLPEPLPLILRVRQSNGTEYEENDFSNGASNANNSYLNQYNVRNDTQLSCTYWNYQTWASDGLMFMGWSRNDPNVILCACTHLTPFAYLIGGGYNNYTTGAEYDEGEFIVQQIHEKALDIITLVGCSCSIVGIICVFITAMTFKSWREKPSTKVLLQLSAAIALQMFLFLFVNTEAYSKYLRNNNIIGSCITIGAMLHYSVLVQFCWMIVIAYLQFKRYVQVFGNSRPQRFFIKSALFAWGLPLIPVVCVVLFDKSSFSNDVICYPSGQALYFGLALPIAAVILANLFIFILVIYNILRSPGSKIRRTEKRLVISQIRLSILLFFMLGFTWIFGLMSTLQIGIAFSYLFCLTATLQGFVIFVYFIVLDPNTRRMWSSYFYQLFGTAKPSFESSMSSTTQTQTI